MRVIPVFLNQKINEINKQYLDPREGKSYETGLKGEFLNGKLNAALSVFQTKQDNVAEETGSFILSPDGTPTTEKAYRSADGVESKGVEFELDGEIANNWNLSFGIAHFNTKDAQGNEVQTMSSRTNANLFTKYKLDKWSLAAV
jgi:outer membrane receptor for ferric coprogen and ferric-rhodotorulic acid